MHPTKKQQYNPTRSGFTLSELAVVIASLTVVALLIVPAMARTRVNSPAAVCLNNLRQMSSAWMMYSADNGGRLVWSYPNYPVGTTTYSWCYGSATGSAGSYNYDGTDPAGLTNAKLWPYVKSIPVYKCGADRRVASIGGVVKPILRSYSMNCYMAGSSFGDPQGSFSVTTGGAQNTFFRVYLKDTEIRYPAKTWVLMDEDAISINDGMFLSNMGADARGLIDLPGRQHDGAYGINFADGHATIQKLTSLQSLTTTTLPVPGGTGNTDFIALTNISTFPQL